MIAWLRSRPPAAPVMRMSASDLASEMAAIGHAKRRAEFGRRFGLTTALLEREIAAGGLIPIRPRDEIAAEARAERAARLRYRKTGGRIVFWYELWRTDRTFDAAFSEAVKRVSAETELPVFIGKPEA